MGGGIGWTAAIGGLVLAAVLLFAVIANRRRSRAAQRRTEEATRDLYARIDRDDHRQEQANEAGSRHR